MNEIHYCKYCDERLYVYRTQKRKKDIVRYKRCVLCGYKIKTIEYFWEVLNE